MNLKLITQIEPLREAVSQCAAVVPQKSTLPALETIRFTLTGNLLEISATDLEISVTSHLEVTGVCSGTLQIPALLFSEWLDKLPEGEITITYDKTTRRMQCETGLSGDNVPTAQFSIDETAELPDVAKTAWQAGSVLPGLTLEAETFRRLASKLTPICSTDELRPAMMGVLFEAADAQPKQCHSEEATPGATEESLPGALNVVATDGFRLLKITVPQACHSEGATPGATEESHDVSTNGAHQQAAFILPAKAMALIAHAGNQDDITLQWNDHHLRATCEHVTITKRYNWSHLKTETVAILTRVEITARLIDEKYPNYGLVIPKETPHALTFSKAALAERAEPMRWCESKNSHRVVIRMNAERRAFHQFVFGAEDWDRGLAGNAYVQADVIPELEKDIHLNGDFFRALLATLETDLVTLRFGERAAFVAEETNLFGEETLAVLAWQKPVRTNTFTAPCDRCQGPERVPGQAHCMPCAEAVAEAQRQAEIARKAEEARKELVIARAKNIANIRKQREEREYFAWRKSLDVDPDKMTEAIRDEIKKETGHKPKKLTGTKWNQMNIDIRANWKMLPDRPAIESFIRSRYLAIIAPKPKSGAYNGSYEHTYNEDTIEDVVGA